MPNWAGSCWYELRYLDPTNAERLVDPEVEHYWMGPTADRPLGGVELYVGGVEHAVLHLLYARFWHKVLYDLGYLSVVRAVPPAGQPGHAAAARLHERRRLLREAAEVEERRRAVLLPAATRSRQEFGKIGKSLKNVVNPDEFIADYGADTFRLFEMFSGPLEQSRPWDAKAIVGPFRLLQRVWRVVRRRGRPARSHVSDDAVAGRAEPPAAQGDPRRPRGLRDAAVQHIHRADHRAEQRGHPGLPGRRRAARGGRAAGADAGADRAAHRRGAVVAAGARRPRWPGRTSRSPTTALLVDDTVEVPGAGQRQAARGDHRAGRLGRRRDGGRGAGPTRGWPRRSTVARRGASSPCPAGSSTSSSDAALCRSRSSPTRPRTCRAGRSPARHRGRAAAGEPRRAHRDRRCRRHRPTSRGRCGRRWRCRPRARRRPSSPRCTGPAGRRGRPRRVGALCRRAVRDLGVGGAGGAGLRARRRAGCRFASHRDGLGFAVLAAARRGRRGGSAAEVQGAATATVDRTRTLFYVDTLEYLRRGGRIGTAAALLATSLSVKPLLHMVEGQIVALEKVRTSDARRWPGWRQLTVRGGRAAGRSTSRCTTSPRRRGPKRWHAAPGRDRVHPRVVCGRDRPGARSAPRSRVDRHDHRASDRRNNSDVAGAGQRVTSASFIKRGIDASRPVPMRWSSRSCASPSSWSCSTSAS